MVSIDTITIKPFSMGWSKVRHQLGLWLVFDFPRWWVGRRQLAPGGISGFSERRIPWFFPRGNGDRYGVCKYMQIYVYGVWQFNIYIYNNVYIHIPPKNITWLVLVGLGPPPRTQNTAFWKSQKNLMTIPPKNNPLLKIDFRDKLRFWKSIFVINWGVCPLASSDSGECGEDVAEKFLQRLVNFPEWSSESWNTIGFFAWLVDGYWWLLFMVILYMVLYAY